MDGANDANLMARSSKGRYFQTGARPGPVPAQPTHGATVGPRCWQRQLRLTCDLAGWLAVILFVVGLVPLGLQVKSSRRMSRSVS